MYKPRFRLQGYFFSARARRAWAAALLALVLFTVATAVAPREQVVFSLGWDKLNHLAAFGALAFVGVFALRGVARAGWLLPAGLLVLGGLIEVMQSFVPGRMADGYDLLADAAGIALGMALGGWFAVRLETRQQRR